MFLFHKKSTIYSPCDGEFKSLNEVKDEVFSKELMGKGFAVVPTTGDIHSPVDGKVTMVFPTKHAIGITDKNNVEYILHIGIDTVQLKGTGFQTSVQEGDSVKAGDLLVNCDLAMLKQAGYQTDVLVIVTNHKDVRIKQAGYLKVKDEIAYCENI